MTLLGTAEGRKWFPQSFSLSFFLAIGLMKCS